MDPGSPRCGRQRDRGRTRERSCTETRRTAELAQSGHLPRSCSQTSIAPRSETRVGEGMGARKDQSAHPATDRSTVPAKRSLKYWFGLRKATTSILMQLRTGRIGLNSYLARINQRESARCDCELGNQTVAHVLLECPLHQAERDWMRRALSGQGIIVSRDEVLTRPEARIVKTGSLGHGSRCSRCG